MSSDSQCTWDGDWVPCSVLGIIAATHSDISFEVDRVNAPPGFGLGLAGQRRLVKDTGTQVTGPSGTDPDGYFDENDILRSYTNDPNLGHWETTLTGFAFLQQGTPQNSLQQTAPGLMNYNVPKNGKIEANYWKRYGKSSTIVSIKCLARALRTLNLQRRNWRKDWRIWTSHTIRTSLALWE